jgi:hypothetical protein
MKHWPIILAACVMLTVLVAAPGASARDTPWIVDPPAFGPHGLFVLHHKLAVALEQNRKQAATIKAFATSSRRVMKELSAERAAKAELCASNAELLAAPADAQALLDAYCGSGMHPVASTTDTPVHAIAGTPDADAAAAPAVSADPPPGPDASARTSPPDAPAATPRPTVPEAPAPTSRPLLPQPPG